MIERRLLDWIGKVHSCIEGMLGCVCGVPRGSACSLGNERLPSDRKENESDDTVCYDLLVTQLVSPLWSVRIAEKERMGLPCPYAVLVDTSAMPVVS